MAKVLLQELSVEGCHICHEFQEFWESVKAKFPNVEFQNVDLTSPQGQELAQKFMIFASPGILLNGELFSSGGFDRDAFIKKLQELSADKTQV